MLIQLSSHDFQSNFENAKILNQVRLIAIIGQLILVLFSLWFLEIHLPLLWVFGLLVLEIIFCTWNFWSNRKIIPISSSKLLLHIIFDSFILAGLIYFSGGPNNPFIYLLLLPIALGTLMLSLKGLILITLLQLLLYSLLNIYQRPLELGDSSPLVSFHLHLTGMWVNFGLTVVLISIFGFITRQSMLQQQRKINLLREKQLKDEQLLSLGIMSASAAHELGTPLATMAIVVDDLLHQALAVDCKNDLNILATQINKCRSITQTLSSKSEDVKERLDKQKNNSEIMFIEQLQLTLDNWLVYRPQIHLTQHWSNELVSLKRTLPISVEQAIINLLNNSADASLANGSDKIVINGSLIHQAIVIEITDFGKGITAEMKVSLGEDIQSTQKIDGLGWGVLLSNASIERANGKVELLEAKEGGTLTKISLPNGIAS
jgi:two-component system sensor histidine kinase RegB